MNKKITSLELKSKLKQAREAAKSTQKQQQITCGGGLYVIIQKGTGTADFYARIGIDNKRYREKLGSADKMTLAAAFMETEKIRKGLNQGKIITPERVPTFKTFYNQWIENYFPTVSPSRQANIKSLYNHVLYILNNYPIDQIKPPSVNKELSRLKTTQSNKRTALKSLKQCLDYAVNLGVIDFNPVQTILKLPEWKQQKTIGFKWITADKLKAEFFDKLQNEKLINKIYYALICLTTCRKSEIRFLKREWIQVAPQKGAPNGVIVVPSDFTKTKTADHVIPITNQIKWILDLWLPLVPEDSPYLFCSNIIRNRGRAPICANSLDQAVTLKAKNCTLHGLRKTFRSYLSENMGARGFSDIAIELCLAHEIRSEVRITYDRYGYLTEKYQILEFWGNYLDLIIKDFIKI